MGSYKILVFARYIPIRLVAAFRIQPRRLVVHRFAFPCLLTCGSRRFVLAKFAMACRLTIDISDDASLPLGLCIRCTGQPSRDAERTCLKFALL